jgi:hypothetical protein
MRDTDTPLYYWIRQRGSVLKFHANSWLHSRPYGRELVVEVLIRYVRLYKGVTSDNVSKMIGRLINRYGTRYHHLPSDLSWFVINQYPRDKVYVEQDGNCFKLTSKEYAKHQKEVKRRRELLDYNADIKSSEAIKAEREEELAHAMAMAEATQPKVKIVNRLTKKLVERYNNIGSDKIPECLSDIPGIHDIPVGHPPGVYILMCGKEIVYVGQSTNPSIRIGQHIKDKIFDRALLIPTMDLDAVEQHYINKFKPKYNIKRY